MEKRASIESDASSCGDDHVSAASTPPMATRSPAGPFKLNDAADAREARTKSLGLKQVGEQRTNCALGRG